VAWLRNEYGYPEGYPQKEEMSKLLPILKYPSEVIKIKVRKPEKLKYRLQWLQGHDPENRR
jgi:hypothetical protein